MQTQSDAIEPGLLQAVSRAFIYRFIAKAFEYPDPEGWWWLSNSDIQKVFCSAVKSISSESAPALETNADRLIPRLQPEAFEQFKSDCLSAFGHTVRGDCPMNEIEYGDLKADPLFQPHRLADLGAFYRAFGLEINPEADERHDHICLELEFMSVLAAKEAYAIQNRNPTGAVTICREVEKKFLREHLGRWTPAFTRRLSHRAEPGALRALAEFSREWIFAECRQFGIQPGSEDLLLRPIDPSAETLCDSCGLKANLPGAIRS